MNKIFSAELSGSTKKDVIEMVTEKETSLVYGRNARHVCTMYFDGPEDDKDYDLIKVHELIRGDKKLLERDFKDNPNKKYRVTSNHNKVVFYLKK